MLEANFAHTERHESTLKAHLALQTKVRQYAYICRRRNRPLFLTEPYLCDALLRLVPEVVQNRVLDSHSSFGELRETFQICQREETLLRARHGNVLPQPTTPKSYAASPAQPANESGRESKIRPCFGCGGLHFRKECPHKLKACGNCGRVGHTTEMCRASIIKDSVGNVRALVEPKRESWSRSTCGTRR